MAPVINVQDLRKVYDDVAVVDGVSFSVDRGECVGILGPNGAGKTTTLEMVEGIRRPDGGTVDILGHAPWPRDPALLRLIGVQLQGTAFIEHLSAIEQLRTVTDLYGVDRTRAEEVLAQVSLSDMAAKDVDDLSGGQRQRLSIACALVHRPQVLFLDEPSTGLDPASRRELWEVLRAVRADGTTVVLTTHYMEEAEELCDRVAVLEGVASSRWTHLRSWCDSSTPRPACSCLPTRSTPGSPQRSTACSRSSRTAEPSRS